MYGIDGRRDLTETTRDDLWGYAGPRPVRIGTGAFDQRQNDAFGAALDSILLHTRRSQRLPRRLWPLVLSQAECATRVWREPDQGIWEARGDPQHYVSSKLMCWVALDASRLLATVFLPGTDDRLRASVLAIADELTEHGFVLRYKTGETDDGLSGKEGTFVICSFWLVSALAIIGETQRDRDLMERLARVASPLGLYAEEFDVDAGRHLGDFSQAFSHLALVEAAGRIILAERIEELSG